MLTWLPARWAWEVLPEVSTIVARGMGDMLPGLPGMIVDTGKVDKISRIPETDIGFGTAVLAGASDGYCRSAATSGDSPYEATDLQFLGIAMRDMTAAGGIINLFAQQAFEGFRKNFGAVPIVRVGRVWAIPSTAVHEGDPVVIQSDGTFRTSDNPDWFIPGARWASSAPAGMLAVVQLNLT